MSVTENLEKTYDRHDIEHKWYKLWLKNNVFAAGTEQNNKKDPYVIMMPPPNVTGALHNGHALFVTLQDILARFWRMKGKDVLWLPGTDHAGISTQTVVERELKKNKNLSRHELGRDKFLKLVWDWKNKHGQRIIEQLQLMGASADWDRLRFTMDEQCSKAVRHAFVKLWNDNLIFRKERLISWDPKTQTALSNEEVDHKDQPGELFYFAYKIKNSPDQEIIVATTRPETMLGDTAVAVNPKDARYKKYIGQELVHPFVSTCVIKIIADDYVDQEFGSGAVKITPAHDPNDFEIGQRHDLKFISILNLDGKINKNGGEFKNLDRFEARKIICQRLRDLDLFRKSETICHSVAISQRSGVPIEPMLSRQYFVNTKKMAQQAYESVHSQETRIIPGHFKKIWDHFLLNIQDWCISRQLWWGHRIPIYYHISSLRKAVLELGAKNPESLCFKALKSNQDISIITKLALDELDEKIIHSFSHALINQPKNFQDYIQEEDVLDTWFSSALWPFSTLGWPEKTPDLSKYYPGAVLETGFDILFFWVARMMMFGVHFMGKPPFRDIFLHAMVRDAHGRKMSKSLGNAIDPIDIINGISLENLVAKTKTYPVPESQLNKILDGIKKEYPQGIPESGADGLRLSLAIFSGQGQDVKFSIPRVLGYRAFLNKVWNATRFALMHVDSEKICNLDSMQEELSVADRFIISKLNSAINLIDLSIINYNFSEAADSIYKFFWNEYCDKYIEYAKTVFQTGSEQDKIRVSSVLIYLLDTSMRLLHPFCPFISEEIWQVLPRTKNHVKFCALADFPVTNKKLINLQAEKIINLVFDISSMIRNARQESNLPANKAIPVKLFAENQEIKLLLEQNKELISHLAKTLSLEIYLRGEHEVTELCASNSNSYVDVVLILTGLINFEKEQARLEKKLAKIEIKIISLQKRLENQNFVEHAPKEVIEQHKCELSDLVGQKTQVYRAQDRLKQNK